MPFRTEQSAKKMHGTGDWHVLQIGPKSSKGPVSIQHGRNIGPTWTNWLQLRPKMAQLGPNLDPFGGNFGPSSGPYGGHSRPNPKSSTRPFSLVCPRFLAIDDASFEAMFPMLCLHWAQLGVKLSPKAPSCGMLVGVHLDR